MYEGIILLCFPNRIHREGGNIPATLRKNKHQRTPSNTSSMSIQDDVLSVNSEVPDDASTVSAYPSPHNVYCSFLCDL